MVFQTTLFGIKQVQDQTKRVMLDSKLNRIKKIKLKEEWKGILDSYMGKLLNLTMFNKLYNPYALVCFDMAKMKYIGEDLMLISGVKGEVMIEICNEGGETRGFWRPSIRLKNGILIYR